MYPSSCASLVFFLWSALNSLTLLTTHYSLPESHQRRPRSLPAFPFKGPPGSYLATKTSAPIPILPQTRLPGLTLSSGNETYYEAAIPSTPYHLLRTSYHLTIDPTSTHPSQFSSRLSAQKHFRCFGSVGFLTTAALLYAVTTQYSQTPQNNLPFTIIAIATDNRSARTILNPSSTSY